MNFNILEPSRNNNVEFLNKDARIKIYFPCQGFADWLILFYYHIENIDNIYTDKIILVKTILVKIVLVKIGVGASLHDQTYFIPTEHKIAL